MPTRMHDALTALMAFVDRGSDDDRLCAEALRVLRDERGIQDETLLLAARFHYPLSPGRDRGKQVAALRGCGYSLNEAKRFITLVESYQGLEGDPQKRLLADLIARLYLTDAFYRPDDAMWTYSLQRVWRCTSDDLRRQAYERCARLHGNSQFPLASTHLELESGVLGGSVRDAFASGCGFPNVYFPWLEHALDISIFDPFSAPMEEFDRCVRAWTQGSAALRAEVTAGLVDYKDRIAESCGEDFAHITEENILSHIDLTRGIVTERGDGLRIALGEHCDWEPEHGVSIILDRTGALKQVDAVG